MIATGIDDAGAIAPGRSMMLSRVADALYWMGRYIERAENLTRLLRVTSEFSVDIEGLDRDLAKAEWEDVFAAVPGTDPSQLPASTRPGLAATYVRTLLLDPDNRVSVLFSVARARENARSIREALTREVFENLNETYLDLETKRRGRLRSPTSALAVVADTHDALLTTLGAIENTLSRDQGWTFLKLGEAIERTTRTLLVIRTKSPELRNGDSALDLPLFYGRCRNLLRSVASLENFRRVHGANLDPERLLAFLLFDPGTPRSVRCGIDRMKHYIDLLPPADPILPGRRTIGKLQATITYDDETILARPDLETFCDEMLEGLGAAHEAVSRAYFSV